MAGGGGGGEVGRAVVVVVVGGGGTGLVVMHMMIVVGHDGVLGLVGGRLAQVEAEEGSPRGGGVVHGGAGGVVDVVDVL